MFTVSALQSRVYTIYLHRMSFYIEGWDWTKVRDKELLKMKDCITYASNIDPVWKEIFVQSRILQHVCFISFICYRYLLPCKPRSFKQWDIYIIMQLKPVRTLCVDELTMVDFLWPSTICIPFYWAQDSCIHVWSKMLIKVWIIIMQDPTSLASGPQLSLIQALHYSNRVSGNKSSSLNFQQTDHLGTKNIVVYNLFFVKLIFYYAP